MSRPDTPSATDEVPEADAVEQAQAVTDDVGPELVDTPTEAEPADVAEQRTDLAGDLVADDDDYPRAD